MNEDLEKRLQAAEKENARLKRVIATCDDAVRSAFRPYVTDEVLDEIIRRRGVSPIGGERRVVTMMFADLRRSTALSEQMEPTRFLHMLNHFFEEMIEIINAWQGNILEFVGDEIAAVFGAPRPNETSARDAVACAVAMQRRMEAVNRWNREQGYPEIGMGIGLHTGEALLGNIGSQTRMKYDMIGRNVNLASRVEGYARGGQILATAQTLRLVEESVQVDQSESLRVRPKGIQEDIQLHSIVGFGRQRIREVENHGG